MSEQIPPPTYSQRDPVESMTGPNPTEPQILIIPTANAVNFQKGFLGAEGERAAIEGELQIKGVNADQWSRVTIALRSFESAYQQEIELSSVKLDLFSRDHSCTSFPTSIPFSLPLLSDTPQSIQTPHSMLAHNLTASLYPVDITLPVLSKSLVVYTRRFSSHTQVLPSSPEAYSLEDPTHVEVQLPRDTYTSGEAIPLYVTVPPPSRETVIDRGLRLRNVRAELVRVVKVKREHVDDNEADMGDNDISTNIGMDDAEVQQQWSSSIRDLSCSRDESIPSSSSTIPVSPLFLGSSYRVVIARSGASCRFHSSRPIQLRFILHQNSSSALSESETNIAVMDGNVENALVTQLTLLHSVLFHIKIHISFVDTSSQSERISTMTIPITILPPPAPLPEVSQAIDEAYQKKHDRPPVKTIREEEVDPSIPNYSEGEAGPSVFSSAAPPPFEERDAPPPFFLSAQESSSSSRLPTFQESEREIILPETNDVLNEAPPLLRAIPGEGTIFGFPSEQQFDGHSEDIQRAPTPPPSLEMASRDTNLTGLTDQPSNIVIEALAMVLDIQEEDVVEEQPPPPPPAMDDPSDPPPSIDSEFRSPTIGRQTSPNRTAPSLRASYQSESSLRLQIPAPSIPPEETQASHGPAPPPYLNADHDRERDNDQVMRPPPYVD